MADFFLVASTENAESKLMAEIRGLEQKLAILTNQGARLQRDLESRQLGPLASFYQEDLPGATRNNDLSRAINWRPSPPPKKKTKKDTSVLEKAMEKLQNVSTLEHAILTDGILKIAVAYTHL